MADTKAKQEVECPRCAALEARSEPTANSTKYTGPFAADGKVVVKAISYNPTSRKSSPVALEKFDISRKSWTLVGINDTKAAAIIDGDPASVWHQRGDKMPKDLVIDLGSNNNNICGFKYLPDQNRWSSGIITTYEFYVSDDNVTWKLVDQGEFSNIKNNPLMQIKTFAPSMARYIKLRALKNTFGDDVAGYAEVDVITK